MFGNQLTSGECGCGCSSPACIQARLIQGSIAMGGLPSSAAAGDADNIRTWINNPSNFPCGGWPIGHAGWQSEWLVDFDTISSTTPDLSTVTNNCVGAQLSGGSTFQAGGYYSITENGSGNATTEFAETARFLITASTAYVVGIWCTDDTLYYQKSCVMTGTAVGDCYQYIIPAPPSDLCAPSITNVCGQVSYFLVPASDPGGWFGQTWSGIVSGCEGSTLAYPCADGFSLTPSACMTGDPFFGDDP